MTQVAQRILSAVKVEANGRILPERSINTYTKRGMNSAKAAVEANNGKQSILRNGDLLTFSLPCYAHHTCTGTPNRMAMLDEHLIVCIHPFYIKAIR